MKLETGIRVHDYMLLERLGAGAFGEVWKAAHVHLPRIAAIKFATSEAAAAAIEREGVAQFGLDHPGIVKVIDAKLEGEMPYVVLEYVEGRNLRQLLRERGRFEVQDVSSIFRQLAEAVSYAHRRGVVHGDIKPENILVQEHGVHKVVKLTDFQLGGTMAGDRPGAAGPDGLRLSLRTTGPKGTYHYLAPEQESGDSIDGRADLFALGVVLFEMATGSFPLGRDLPSDVNPALSWWWDHIFSRCYTGKERRYPDADMLLRDIRSAEMGPAWGEMPSQKATTGSGRIKAVKNFRGLASCMPNPGDTGEEPGPPAGEAGRGGGTLDDAEGQPVAIVGAGAGACDGHGSDSLAARIRITPISAPCAPPRRGTAYSGLVVGMLALLIPAGALSSIAAFGRLGPYGVPPPRPIGFFTELEEKAKNILETDYTYAHDRYSESVRNRDKQAWGNRITDLEEQARKRGYTFQRTARGDWILVAGDF